MRSLKPKGVITPLLTPLSNGNTIDKKGLVKCAQRMIKANVHGLFLLGSTGEFAALTEDQKLEIIEAVIKAVDRNVAVYLGVSDTGTNKVIRNIKLAEKYRIDALVACPPYYFSIGQREILNFYEKISSVTDRPIIIYNIPQVRIRVETILDLMDIPNIIGIKDSTSDFVHVDNLICQCKSKNEDFAIFQGTEQLFVPTLMSGGDGAIPGLANVYPELFTEIYSKYISQELDALLNLQRQVALLSQLYHLGCSPIGGIKKALKIMGVISSDYVFHPLSLPPPEAEKRIIEIIEKLNIR